MHTKFPTTALLLTLALTVPTRADTFTWAGNTANFSDPTAWLGPIPTGSPTDQLLFPDQPPNATYTATLDSPTPFALNSLTFGSDNFPLATNGLNATITALSTGSLLFDGPNPTITFIPTTYLYTNVPIPFLASNTPSVTVNVPITSTSNLTITGNGSFTLNAPLVFTSPNAQLTVSGNLNYEMSAAPVGLGQTNINNGSLGWSYTAATPGPLTLTFGSGDIALSNGTFGVEVEASAPTGFNTTITNNFSIQGVADLQTSGNTSSTPTGTFRYTGTINLHGTLQIVISNSVDVAGTIELNEADNVQPWLEGFNVDPSTLTITTISGAITDDPDPSSRGSQPLALGGFLGLIITGTHNTYSVGTAIEFGDVFVAPTSSLGTGSVDIQGGTLHLSAPSNIAAGRTILVEPRGVLAITFDADPSALIDPASQGTLALDPPNAIFSTPLNLATLGIGMSLGTTTNSTYTPLTLAPGSDHVYRFAQVGGSTLTLLHPVLIDYNGIPSSAVLGGVTLPVANSYSGGSTILGDVYANAPGALGTGNVTVGAPPTDGEPSPGRLFLTAPNAYTTTATVNLYGTLAVTGPNGSLPNTSTPPIFHPGSTLALGDNLTNNSNLAPDTLPLNLNTTTLQLNGVGTTNEAVGPISFAGLSTLLLQNPYSDDSMPLTTTHTTLSTPSISQEKHAVLMIELNYTTLDPTSTNNAAVYIASPPALTNGILPPYIQTRSTDDGDDPSFLTYGPSGVAPAAYVPFPTTGGTGTEIADIPQNTDANNNAIPFTLPMSTSLYALRTGTSIANPAAGPATLHILSGGLIVTSFGEDILLAPNIDFTNTEAYINTTGYTFGGNNIELAGQVTALHGITKFGAGTLYFSNPADTLAGPITLYEGGLSFAALPQPTSTDPIVMSTGSTLNFTNTTTLTRPILLTANNLNYGLYANISTSPGQSLALAAPITGNSPVTITSGNLLSINYPLHFNSDLAFAAATIHLAANITADYVSYAGTLTGSGVITSRTGNYLYQSTTSPGDYPGDRATLVFDSPTSELGYGEIFTLDLAPSGLSDRILFTGNLTIDPPNGNLPPITLSLNFLAPPTGQIYTLLSYASLTGTFSTVTGLPPNYSLDYTPTALLLLPTTPEPTSLALLTLFAPLLLGRHARKKNPNSH